MNIKTLGRKKQVISPNAIQVTSKNKSYFFLFLVFLLLLACLCQYDPYASLYSTEQPNASKIMGSYILKSQTLTTDGLAIFQGIDCLIEIRTNGNFTATHFPKWQRTNNRYAIDAWLNVTGIWELDIIGDISINDQNTKDVWGITFDSKELGSAHLTGNKPPYGLIFTYGDPDSGTVMVFEKVKD